MMAATGGRGGEEGEQIEEAGTKESTLEQYYGRLAAWSGTESGIGDFLTGMSKTMTQYGQATGAFTP